MRLTLGCFFFADLEKLTKMHETKHASQEMVVGDVKSEKLLTHRDVFIMTTKTLRDAIFVPSISRSWNFVYLEFHALRLACTLNFLYLDLLVLRFSCT